MHQHIADDRECCSENNKKQHSEIVATRQIRTASLLLLLHVDRVAQSLEKIGSNTSEKVKETDTYCNGRSLRPSDQDSDQD